jgi:hypothetical protein
LSVVDDVVDGSCGHDAEHHVGGAGAAELGFPSVEILHDEGDAALLEVEAEVLADNAGGAVVIGHVQGVNVGQGVLAAVLVDIDIDVAVVDDVLGEDIPVNGAIDIVDFVVVGDPIVIFDGDFGYASAGTLNVHLLGAGGCCQAKGGGDKQGKENLFHYSTILSVFHAAKIHKKSVGKISFLAIIFLEVLMLLYISHDEVLSDAVVRDKNVFLLHLNVKNELLRKIFLPLT